MADPKSCRQLDENLSFQVRKDIQVDKQTHGGEVFYVAKDPLSLKYYRMRDVEYFIFTLLDGTKTIKDIISLVNKRFGKGITDEEIKNFILALRNMNLLDTFGPGADRLLYHRSVLKKRAKLKQLLMGWFFIKLPIIDPDKLLNKIYMKFSFIWTRSFFYLWLALIGLAIFLIADKSTLFFIQAKDFFAPKNILLIASALMIIKAWHEFGHALTCKYYGGEVHEMGILFIVFTPWLYVNVSDSWIFQKSRQRFLVSVAGLMTEFLVATIAAALWWFTKPGIFNSLCFNIVIVCSVDNLLRNANPLLRYDGYYALSDYIEIPNLRAKSSAYLSNLRRKYLLRMHVEEEELSAREKRIYVVYGILSFCYRVFIMLAIIKFIAGKFFILGVILAAVMITGSFLMPLYKGATFVVTNRSRIGYRGASAYTLSFIAISVIAFLFFYHPHVKIKSSFSAEALERAVIRTEEGGFLDELLKKQGDRVTKGETIALLKNPELSASYKMLKIERDAIMYEERKALSAGNVTEYNQHRLERERVEKDMVELEKRLGKLRIVAPREGVILTPRLEEKIGDYIEHGGFVCETGSTGGVEIEALVSGTDVTEVKAGQDVELRAYAYPDSALKGKVESVSGVAVKTIDNLALSARFGGKIITEPQSGIGEVPRDPYFEVKIDVSEPSLDLFKPGMTGRAKIYGDKRSLALIIYEKLQKVIRPDLLLR
jgi:putative peptide zinc metalloprotease protein